MSDAARARTGRFYPPQPWAWILLVLGMCPWVEAATNQPDTLDGIRERGRMIWGADSEGGGPYVFPNPDDPRRMSGFEVELADALAGRLGAKAQFYQGPWHNLPALLGTRQIDLVLNGYELTPSRAARMLHTRPYYIYQLVLLARRDDPRLTGWDDLSPRGTVLRGLRPRIGVLQASAAQAWLEEHYGDNVELVLYEGTTDAMREVETGKLDATMADLPAVIFYRDRFERLAPVGDPVGQGYYVIFVRNDDVKLRDALDAAIGEMLLDNSLKAIYERYGMWNDKQDELVGLAGRTPEDLGIRATRLRGWEVIRDRGWLLVQAAGMTVFLTVCAMPLAMLIGLVVAVGRLYGPAPLRWLLTIYVEVLRGTPLLLQLYVIFFVLPEVGVAIAPVHAAIAGLAINYSAYESEIYRAGLLAVPRGQWEAALALGMSPGMTLWRIIIPQAVRIVVPPVTNDFIAMFKDTSVCSVITVMELTKQYTVQQNDTGATLELAALTALLYLAMSLPLSRLATILERRLARQTHER